MATWKGVQPTKQIKDEVLIAALISCPTIKEAAQKAGIGETTLHKKLKDPDFSAKYYKARLEMLKSHVATLHSHLGSAIDTMQQVMISEQSSQQTKLNAAEAIIRNCLKLTEDIDFEERLHNLEERMRIFNET